MQEDEKAASYDWGEDPADSTESGSGAARVLPPEPPDGKPEVTRAAEDDEATGEKAESIDDIADDPAVSEEIPWLSSPETQDLEDREIAGSEPQKAPADGRGLGADADVSWLAEASPAAEDEARQLASPGPRKSEPEVETEPSFEELIDDSESPTESFDSEKGERLGIVGGKGVGKSYLFQAMVYRTCSGSQAGALSCYLRHDSARLFSSFRRTDRPVTLNLRRFVDNYSRWIRLPFTAFEDQRWYKLRLQYRTGFLGRTRSTMDVEYFDGSGEGFFSAMRSAENRELWRDGFLDATVMVFCLPLWAAFPASYLSDDDWQWRDDVLQDFEQVIQNYLDLREEHGRRHPVSTILALTMADDKMGALETLRDRWITPYMDGSQHHLQQLRKGPGVARYLANARRVSEAMHEEFHAAGDPLVASIPQKLDFGRGRPWVIPLSAVDGSLLDHVESRGEAGTVPGRLPNPVPVHVELPLLVALCERHNALL